MRRLGASLALAVVLLLPAGAHAARVELEFKGEVTEPTGHGGSVRYSVYDVRLTAAPGELNRVSAQPAYPSIRVEDAAGPIAPGTGCRSDGAAALCDPPAAARLRTLVLDLGDGDDTARVERTWATVLGGPGDDRASAGNPEPFDRTWVSFDGGPGSDTASADGSAWILADYSTRSAPVTATTDGVANDGEAGEGDLLGPGVEGINGGSGDDVLDAAGAPTARLTGGPGDDRVSGGAGDDQLEGNDGDDALAGASGEDWANGGNGDDTVIGGDGEDHLSGYGGRTSPLGERNLLDGGDGPDEFFVGGGSGDDVRGGPGVDRADYGDVDRYPVEVTLDDLPGDGLKGEQDNVHSDVEDLHSPEGDDHLVGTDGPNLLDAGAGRNRVEGRGGDDVLRGSEASRPVDTSVLDGGAGNNLYARVYPRDVIRAGDGERDAIECSSGGGVFQVDPVDTSSGCAPSTPFGGPIRVRFDRRGRARITARCSPSVEIPCRGRIVLARRPGAAFLRQSFNFKPRRRAYSFVLRMSRRRLADLRRRPRGLIVTSRVQSFRDAPSESRIDEWRWTLVARR